MNKKNSFDWFLEIEMYLRNVFVTLELDRCINVLKIETQRGKSVKIIIIMDIIYIII